MLRRVRSREPSSGVARPEAEPVAPTSLSFGARFFVWSSTPTGLAVLFAAGFVLRLWLARGGGFPFDMSSFAAWAGRLADKGPWDFYPRPGENFFVDYPPGYLYVLYVLGAAARALGMGAPSVLVLKIPPILADLALAWLVGALAMRVAPAGRRFPVRGIAAAVILFNPAIFFVSATWGQADSVFTLLLVAAFVLLGDADASLRREAAGAALVSAAIITKPQALFVLPVVVVVLAWRHLRARPAGQQLTDGLVRLGIIGVAGALAGTVLIAPFRMSPAKAVSFYAAAAKTYPMTSVFAFNFWGAVGFWRPDSGRDAVQLFGLPAATIGLIVFSIAAVLVLLRVWRALETGETQPRTLAFGGIALTLVGFATLTRIHERYLFVAVALLAAFVSSRRMRWALAGVSTLFFLNVYFPYVYYLRYVHRPAPDLGGLFDAFYGRDVAGARLRLLSLLTGVVAVYIASAGWRWVTATDRGAGKLPAPEPPQAPVEPPKRLPWTLRLHPVGRRGALLAVAVFAVAFVSRVAGLGHPPGMYFDEVYHARTGAEYLNDKEVYEWTHPPLAKELIGLSIASLSGFRASPLVPLRSGAQGSLIASGETGNVWAIPDGAGANIQRGRIDAGCRLRPIGAPVHVDVRPETIAATKDRVFVAGVGRDGRELVRLDGSREAWRVPVGGRVKRIAPLGDAAYLLRDDGTLVSVAASGTLSSVGTNATAVASSPRDSVVWAAYSAPARVASWDASGRRTAEISVSGFPRDVAVPESTKRVLVADGSTDQIEVVDAEASKVSATLRGPASFVGTVSETQLGWAAGARSMKVIEPRGGSILGEVPLPATVDSIVAEPRTHRMVAVAAGGLSCISGRPWFAWRFGSAVTGSLMIAFVALIALRLFGSVAAAALAALFVTIDGLAFTISRIAMNDSYVTGFVLASWFCVLSALYRWGRSGEPRSRPATLAWLAASGAFAGLGLASKWVGLYALGAICVLVAWDALTHGRDGILAVMPNPVLSAAVVGALLIGVPLALYLLSYVPYFSLGHSFVEFAKLQQMMYGYHANLRATHPFGASWYGWPFGHRAVFLYLANHGFNRSEIWTIPNIVVFWGGLIAIGAAAARAVRTKSVALVVLVGAALAQYLPWTAVSRVAFLYHYLPVVPFLAIALGWGLVEGLRGSPHRWRATAFVTAAAVAFFFFTLPALEGWEVSASTLNTIRRSLPWILPP